MTCPRCYAEFSAPSGVCPQCGVQLLKTVSGMMKTSAVLIAAGGARSFYGSVGEVPEGLRQQLLRVTSSENSGTIVIADRAGREQLTQIVARRDAKRGQQGDARRGLTEGKRGQADAKRGQATKIPVARVPVTAPRANRMRAGRLPWTVWVGLLLLLGSAGVVAAVFTLRW